MARIRNEDFKPILEIAEIMRGFPAAWFVSGGWAIDLFLGEVTRSHSDIEIGIYRRDQQLLRAHLRAWSLSKAIACGDDGEWVSWPLGEELQLPVHQIKATRPDGEGREFEIFLNECSERDWISRRHAGVARRLGEAVMISAIGIPFLVPEIQLLFKAKYRRAKDEADFNFAVRRMSGMQKKWLARVLGEHHEGHGWIAALDE